MAYGVFKDLNRRTFADEVLWYKTFNIAKDPKYDRYQRGLVSMVHNFFNKKAERLLVVVFKKKTILNKELAEELHKPIIRKFNKRENIHLLLTICGALI